MTIKEYIIRFDRDDNGYELESVLEYDDGTWEYLTERRVYGLNGWGFHDRDVTAITEDEASRLIEEAV